jgi:hypothetical protein
MKPHQVWELPFAERPVLEFEANASTIEVVPLEPGGKPRIEARRAGTQLEVKQVGETVVVRMGMDNPWGGNPFDRVQAAHDEHMSRHGRRVERERERDRERGRSPLGEEIVRGIAEAVFNRRFGGAFTLYVPANVQARLTCNMGEVEVRGLAGCDVGVFTNAGSLIIDECRGRFQLRAKAGRILCRRVAGTFDIESGMGEAMLDIVALDPGVHRVVSTMGSVKVELAPGLDVKIDSRTVMGSTRTRYPSRNDAPATLRVEAELGSVKVREGSAYVDLRHGDWPDWRKQWKDAAPPPVQDVPPSPESEGSELRKILDLVQQKKVSPEEAERLISALHGN